MFYPILEPTNSMCRPKRKNLLKIIPPLRIVTIITILSLHPAFNIEWESATILFYSFFAIFVANYFFEAILYPTGIFKGMKALYSKHNQSLSIEFVGIAIFALLSFFPHDGEYFWWAIFSAILVIGCGTVIEVLHRFVMPRLYRVQVTPTGEMLSLIGMTVMLYFVGTYASQIISHRIQL